MESISYWTARPGLLALVLAVGTCGYAVGVLVTGRERVASIWLVMIVLAPFAALLSSVVAVTLQLMFFVVTLGGEIKGVQTPLTVLFTAAISAAFGVWATGTRNLSFRVAVYSAAVIVALYVLLSSPV